MLARLSGGIVVNIHNVKTIIMFRGRNYRQPKNLIPINTLTKRKVGKLNLLLCFTVLVFYHLNLMEKKVLILPLSQIKGHCLKVKHVKKYFELS